MPAHEELLSELEEFARTAPTVEALMQKISERLHEALANYNWVGFYLVDRADLNMLVIGPYVGSFSPNLRIPLDRGLCGAAARLRQTVVSHDVSTDPRYLAGATTIVKSEVVVPILVRGALAGEFDVESYFTGTFDIEERLFAESVATIVADYMTRH
jgi:GAF domain-containing protein